MKITNPTVPSREEQAISSVWTKLTIEFNDIMIAMKLSNCTCSLSPLSLPSFLSLYCLSCLSFPLFNPLLSLCYPALLAPMLPFF